jgi:hypothetical protein
MGSQEVWDRRMKNEKAKKVGVLIFVLSAKPNKMAEDRTIPEKYSLRLKNVDL